MTSRWSVDTTDEKGALRLPEITTPTAEPNFGKVYTKSNDRLYFQDGAGNEHEIVEVGVEHGEIYLDGNGNPVTIATVNDPMALEGFSSSHLKDFTVVPSKDGVITDTEDNGGTLRITDVAHGLVTGDIVTINGLATPAQNGVTAITKVTNDVFDCDDISFATIDETGTWEMGTYLLVSTGGAGTYLANMSSSATSAAVGKVYLLELYIDTTSQPDAKVERKYTAADIGSIGLSGLITLVAGNRIWLAITNITDASEITFKHANLVLHRI